MSMHMHMCLNHAAFTLIMHQDGGWLMSAASLQLGPRPVREILFAALLRGAFCLHVRTLTFCQRMGFLLNH